MRESLTFKDSTFPIEVCTDDYSMLPERMLNCHWHHELELGVVTRGELDYYISGERTLVREGDCVFINGNTMHMANQAAGCRKAVMSVIAFSPELLVSKMDTVIYQKYFQPIVGKPVYGFSIPHDHHEGERIGSMIRQIHGLSHSDFGYELHCLSSLCLMWDAVLAYVRNNNPALFEMRINRENEEYAKSILYYIRQHFSEDISIDQIARHVNISRSECFRCFRRFTNKTPVEYIIEYRLANAAKLLMETSYSIKKVSGLSGFSNTSYFCKMFKKRYEIPPAQYRRNFG